MLLPVLLSRSMVLAVSTYSSDANYAKDSLLEYAYAESGSGLSKHALGGTSHRRENVLQYSLGRSETDDEMTGDNLFGNSIDDESPGSPRALKLCIWDDVIEDSECLSYDTGIGMNDCDMHCRE